MAYGVPDLSRPLNRRIWRGLDGIFRNVVRSPFGGVGRVAFYELTALGLLLFKRGQQLPVFGTLTNPLDGFKGSAGVIRANCWLTFLTPDSRTVISARARIKSSSWSQRALSFTAGTF